MNGQSGPTWLTEPCPSWCVRDHREDDHPDDRYHQSEPTIVPAIAGDGDAVPATDSLMAVDLSVRVGRHLDDELTWVAIETMGPGPGMMLSAESARLFLDRLERQVALTEGR